MNDYVIGILVSLNLEHDPDYFFAIVIINLYLTT